MPDVWFPSSVNISQTLKAQGPFVTSAYFPFPCMWKKLCELFVSCICFCSALVDICFTALE